jgi:hypoxanthine phosphoribosyltransferase
VGKEIALDHLDSTPLLVGVLNGCVMFVADLMKAIPIPHEIDFVSVSSYRLASESNRSPQLLKDLEKEIIGRDVVLVEDIVDTGLTLMYLQDILRARNPKALRTACLLSKPSRRQVDVKVEYTGFAIDDRFVVGYGLDYAEQYRNLPYIAVLE